MKKELLWRAVYSIKCSRQYSIKLVKFILHMEKEGRA